VDGVEKSTIGCLVAYSSSLPIINAESIVSEPARHDFEGILEFCYVDTEGSSVVVEGNIVNYDSNPGNVPRYDCCGVL
jgi:hypothetical protein